MRKTRVRLVTATAAAPPDDVIFEATTSASSSRDSLASSASSSSKRTKAIGADREDADAPALFDPDSGFTPVAAWPYSMSEIPRADGQYWKDAKHPTERVKRDDQFYGADWLYEQRRRELLIASDKVYQFIELVAGHTGTFATMKQLARGDGSNRAMLDMMITVALGDFTSSQGLHHHHGGDDVSMLPGVITQSPSRPDGRRFVVDDATRDANRLQHLVKQEGALKDRQSLLRPANRREVERIVRQTEEREAVEQQQQAAGGKKRSLSSGASDPPAAVPASSVRHDTTTPGRGGDLFTAPQDVESSQHLRARPAASNVRVRLVEKQSPDDQTAPPPKTPTDSNIRVGDDYIYGVDDKWVQLFQLMKQKGLNSIQMDAWKILYEKSLEDPEVQMMRDPKLRRAFLEDVSKVQELLRRGEGGLEWAKAPENVGYVFMTPMLTAAMLKAERCIQQACGKPWVYILDLMTHDEVRSDFSELVAHFVIASKISGFVGRTTSKDSVTSEQRRFARLKNKFTKELTRFGGSQLVFSRSFSASAVSQRQQAQRRQERSVEETGSYFTGARSRSSAAAAAAAMDDDVDELALYRVTTMAPGWNEE